MGNPDHQSTGHGSGSVRFEVVTSAGRVVPAEVRLRLDWVEFLVDGRNRAVFDRDLLREWLANPVGRVLGSNDVLLSFPDPTPGWADGPVVLTLPDVPDWPLSPAAEAALVELV